MNITTNDRLDALISLLVHVVASGVGEEAARAAKVNLTKPECRQLIASMKADDPDFFHQFYARFCLKPSGAISEWIDDQGRNLHTRTVEDRSNESKQYKFTVIAPTAA